MLHKLHSRTKYLNHYLLKIPVMFVVIPIKTINQPTKHLYVNVKKYVGNFYWCTINAQDEIQQNGTKVFIDRIV